MCIICIELLKQKMTIPEATINARELLFSSATKNEKEVEHLNDLYEALEDLDIEKIDKVIFNDADDSSSVLKLPNTY